MVHDSQSLLAQPLTDSFYDLNAVGIDGEEVSMRKFEGNVVLVVNTASRCGFVSQFEGLEKLYEKHRDRGFVVLGFPSNDFLGQEPRSDEEIKTFCQINYKTSFPLFSKVAVTGNGQHPVFKFLTKTANNELSGEVRWNFEKFLIDRSGGLVGRWRSFIGPSSPRIGEAIEKALG